MKAKSLVVVGICSCVGCACLVFAVVRPRLPNEPALRPEPVYQGTPLRVWATELTKHGEFDLRPPDRAAKALREMGPAAVPFLIEWLPKPSEPVTRLERLLSEVPVLGRLFRDAKRGPRSPVSSEAVVAAFRVLGPDARAALPTLAKTLRTTRFSTRDYAAWHSASEAIPWIGSEAVPVMLTVVTNLQGIHERWVLIRQFGLLGSNGAPAIPALVVWTGDQDPWVRLGAVSALGEIAQQAELVVPVLRVAALTDPDALVRRDAAEALGSFGPGVIPDLIKALHDSDWQVRSGAVGGLGKVAVDRPELVLPLLDQYLRDDNWIIRRSAAYALGFSGSKAGYMMLMAATNISEIGDIIHQFRATTDPEALK